MRREKRVNTKAAFAKVLSKVKQMDLPEGYAMKVFGEEETQEESNQALAANMPLTLILMFIVLLLLFRTYRKPTVILLMVPLIFIGVVFGLLVMEKCLTFLPC